jgi:serine/threonine protein kinase
MVCSCIHSCQIYTNCSCSTKYRLYFSRLQGAERRPILGCERVSTSFPFHHALGLTLFKIFLRDSIIQEEKIGTGPFYEIFRGTFAGRAVAIKKLVVEPFKSTFYRAMDLWTDLGHPNVLSTYAATTKNPFLYITPYMEGGTLVQFLKQLVSSKALSTSTMQLGLPQPKQGINDDEEILQDRRLLSMMYEIANGMEYLHSQGILHGALKAANILLDDNNSCVISDFGQTAMRKECGDEIAGVIRSPSGYIGGSCSSTGAMDSNYTNCRRICALELPRAPKGRYSNRQGRRLGIFHYMCRNLDHGTASVAIIRQRYGSPICFE